MKRYRQQQHGMTLLELLVVVAIIGILVTVSLPNIPPIIAGNRVRTSGNDFLIKTRYVRTISMSWRRKLEMTLDVDKQTFRIVRPEHVEYDLLKDIAGAVEKGQSIDDDRYILYKEEGGPVVVCFPEWGEFRTSDTSTCEYSIGRRGNNGVDEMETDCPNNKIIFSPMGTIGSTCKTTITNNLIQRNYDIKVYKGGQVLLRRS